jgi:hypothetical protein
MAKLEWTVRFYVDECWVSDGFNLGDSEAQEMLANYLPYAYGHELGAKVISRPNPLTIKKLQGDKV